MNRIFMAATVLGLVVAFPALATRILNQPEDAYELTLGDVRLPHHVGDAVSFKPCPECDTVALRVTADTRCFVHGQPVAVVDLAKLTAELPPSTYVFVFFDKESRFVNRLAIDWYS